MPGLLSASEIETIRELLQLKTLEICVSQKWGSDQADYRERIRADLGAKTCCASSISHAPGLGGYVCTQDPGVFIGFDIELSSRVTPAIVQRICKTELEALEAPSPAALWTAKEAAYKSLRGLNQPEVISEISITGWVNRNFSMHGFQLSNSDLTAGFVGYGVGLQQGDFHLGIFCLRPR